MMTSSERNCAEWEVGTAPYSSLKQVLYHPVKR